MTYHNSKTTQDIASTKLAISQARANLKKELAPLYKRLHDLQRRRYIEVYGAISEAEQAKLDKIKEKA